MKKYEFTMIDVGDYGRLSNGSVFSSSNIGIAMEHNILHLTPARTLPRTNKLFQYIFVDDDVFPLKSHMVKPFPRGAVQYAKKLPTILFQGKEDCRK